MTRRNLHKIISLFLAAAMLFTMCIPAFASDGTAEEKLQFGEDGKFKILVISDTQDTQWTISNVLTLIQRSLDESNPDFVVFLGDQLKDYDSDFDGENSRWKVEKAIREVVAPVARRNIPFAVVFGNHDGGTDVSKEEQVKIYQQYNGCMMVDEGDSVSGVGNYNIPVYSSKDGSKIAYNFYFMDSHEGRNGVYESIKPDQVEWYINTSNALKKQNGGKPVPSVQFQHVPLPAFRTIIREDLITSGVNNDGIAGPYTDSGLQRAMENQGDVTLAVCGHQHKNTFIGTLNGIDYCSTPGCGFNEYGLGMERAVREIVIDENNPRSYETRLISFVGLLGDNPVTRIRYRLFTNGALDGDLKVVIPEVLKGIVDALWYEMQIHKDNPLKIVPDLLEFFGADMSYLRNLRK